jgi:hypothetical protein
MRAGTRIARSGRKLSYIGLLQLEVSVVMGAEGQEGKDDRGHDRGIGSTRQLADEKGDPDT